LGLRNFQSLVRPFGKYSGSLRKQPEKLWKVLTLKSFTPDDSLNAAYFSGAIRVNINPSRLSIVLLQ
jgi:hypothetical protein